MSVEFLLATVGVTALLGNSTCMTQSPLTCRASGGFLLREILKKIAVISPELRLWTKDELPNRSHFSTLLPATLHRGVKWRAMLVEK